MCCVFLICVYLCVTLGTCMPQHTWRSEDKLRVLIWDLGFQTRVDSLYPQSHLSGPSTLILKQILSLKLVLNCLTKLAGQRILQSLTCLPCTAPMPGFFCARGRSHVVSPGGGAWMFCTWPPWGKASWSFSPIWQGPVGMMAARLHQSFGNGAMISKGYSKVK